MASLPPLIAYLITKLPSLAPEDQTKLLKTIPADQLPLLGEFSSNLVREINSLKQDPIFNPAIRAVFDRIIQAPLTNSPKYNLWKLIAAPINTLSYNKLEEAKQFLTDPNLSMESVIDGASADNVKALLLDSSKQGLPSIAKATLSACLAKATQLDTESHKNILETLNRARKNLVDNPSHYQQCAQIVKMLTEHELFKKSIEELPTTAITPNKSEYVTSLLGLVFGSFSTLSLTGRTKLDVSNFSLKPPELSLEAIKSLLKLLDSLNSSQTNLFSGQGFNDYSLMSRRLSYSIAHTLFSEHHQLGKTIFMLPEIKKILIENHYTALQEFSKVDPSEVLEFITTNQTPYLLFVESTPRVELALYSSPSAQTWTALNNPSRATEASNRLDRE